mmetsp:Transcript_30861/g.78664  ORF Transcript_30861/g.78664 Transcript_30861/m.78664 type:complete len:232 (+) Transcript_30861:699-1394(+)
MRQEGRVRVRLDGPVVRLVPAVLDDLAPEYQEDRRVQRRLELATHWGRQGAVEDLGEESERDVRRLIAVDGVLVAAEDAHATRELHPQQPGLVAGWEREREAEQRVARLPTQHGDRPVHLHRLPGREGIVLQSHQPRPRLPTLEVADVRRGLTALAAPAPCEAAQVACAALAALLGAGDVEQGAQVVARILRVVPHEATLRGRRRRRRRHRRHRCCCCQDRGRRRRGVGYR